MFWNGLLAGGSAVCAEPAGFWRFEGGQPGEAAAVVASEVNGAAMAGKAGVSGQGSPPVYDGEAAHKELWDGLTGKPAVTGNGASLRFRAPEDAPRGGAPVGGEVVVPGGDPAVKPESFSVAAFFKIAAHVPRHALIARKRRNGQAGRELVALDHARGPRAVRYRARRGREPPGSSTSVSAGHGLRTTALAPRGSRMTADATGFALSGLPAVRRGEGGVGAGLR